MKQYIVDAFTDKPFSGNPAAVCILDRPLSDEIMQALAAENNLAETAFAIREGDRYRIRWFTPSMEEELCGHATLATSFVILNFVEPDADEVRYVSISGELSVRRIGDRYELNFPTYPLSEIPVTDAMARAFGARPEKAILGLDLNCVFSDEETVRGLDPDYALLKTLPGRIWNATARQRIRLRVPELHAGDRRAGGPGVRLGALPDRGLLGANARQTGDLRVSGVGARRRARV